MLWEHKPQLDRNMENVFSIVLKIPRQQRRNHLVYFYHQNVILFACGIITSTVLCFYQVIETRYETSRHIFALGY